MRPVRSAGGQRHDTDENVARLQLLVRATRGGRQIGEIGAHAYGDVIREIGADPLNSVTALRSWLRRRIAVPMV